jgi:dTMP kinase
VLQTCELDVSPYAFRLLRGAAIVSHIGREGPQHDSLRFIAFEGADGAGKTTQARLLAAHLRATGADVVEVREPGGTPTGESVRAIVLEGSEPVSARAEALLFAAARAQLVEDVVEPALERGAVVIADRYVGSSLVYQGVVRGVGVDAVRTINDIGTAGLLPDATVLITVSAEQAAARRKPGTADRIEREPLEFHREVIAAYEQVLAPIGGLVHVDGSGDAEAIAARVREALGL